MPKDSSDRIELLQGTLDMLILRTLLFGPARGHQIAKHIQRTTDDLLQVEGVRHKNEGCSDSLFFRPDSLSM